MAWTGTAAAGPGRHERRPRAATTATSWKPCSGWRATAARWRALPAAWGNWHTTYTRFQRWTASGVWATRVLGGSARRRRAAHAAWSTRPPCQRSCKRAEPAKKRTASPDSQPRRLDHQAARRGRRPRRLVRCRLPAGQRRDAPQATPLLDALAPSSPRRRPRLRCRPSGGVPGRPRHTRRDSAPSQAPPSASLCRRPSTPSGIRSTCL